MIVNRVRGLSALAHPSSEKANVRLCFRLPELTSTFATLPFPLFPFTFALVFFPSSALRPFCLSLKSFYHPPLGPWCSVCCMLMRGACSLCVSLQMFKKDSWVPQTQHLWSTPFFFLVFTGHKTSASQETDVGDDRFSFNTKGSKLNAACQAFKNSDFICHPSMEED